MAEMSSACWLQGAVPARVGVWPTGSDDLSWDHSFRPCFSSPLSRVPVENKPEQGDMSGHCDGNPQDQPGEMFSARECPPCRARAPVNTGHGTDSVLYDRWKCKSVPQVWFPATRSQHLVSMCAPA